MKALDPKPLERMGLKEQGTCHPELGARAPDRDGDPYVDNARACIVEQDLSITLEKTSCDQCGDPGVRPRRFL